MTDTQPPESSGTDGWNCVATWSLYGCCTGPSDKGGHERCGPSAPSSDEADERPPGTRPALYVPDRGDEVQIGGSIGNIVRVNDSEGTCEIAWWMPTGGPGFGEASTLDAPLAGLHVRQQATTSRPAAAPSPVTDEIAYSIGTNVTEDSRHEVVYEPPPSPVTGDERAARVDQATRTISLHDGSDCTAFRLDDWTLLCPPHTSPLVADLLLEAALAAPAVEVEPDPLAELRKLADYCHAKAGSESAPADAVYDEIGHLLIDALAAADRGAAE